jgi:hypothetical protein
MIDIESKIKSLKLSWLKRAITHPHAAWKLLVDEMLKEISLDNLIKCRYSEEKFNKLPNFYKNIIKYWNEINEFHPTTRQSIIYEPLWHNKYITVENKTISWVRWQEQGIQTIHHLLNTDKQFLTCEELNSKYSLNCNFMEHLRIRQAIPLLWRSILSSTTNETVGDPDTKHRLYITVNSKDLDIIQTPSNVIYWLLIHKKTNINNHQHAFKDGRIYFIWTVIFGLYYLKHLLSLAGQPTFSHFNIGSYIAFYHVMNG